MLTKLSDGAGYDWREVSHVDVSTEKVEYDLEIVRMSVKPPWQLSCETNSSVLHGYMAVSRQLDDCTEQRCQTWMIFLWAYAQAHTLDDKQCSLHLVQEEEEEEEEEEFNASSCWVNCNVFCQFCAWIKKKKQGGFLYRFLSSFIDIASFLNLCEYLFHYLYPALFWIYTLPCALCQ